METLKKCFENQDGTYKKILKQTDSEKSMCFFLEEAFQNGQCHANSPQTNPEVVAECRFCYVLDGGSRNH